MYRWYGSRCGRQRTSTHSGISRASRPVRSSACSPSVAPAPAPRMRRNASRTASPQSSASGEAMTSTASSSAADSDRPSSAASATSASASAACRSSTCSEDPPEGRPWTITSSVSASTTRACSKTVRIRPSSAISRGSSWNPMTFAMSCCCSRSSRSVRRPLSRCMALLTRVRNSSAASSRARSALRSRPSSSSDRPRTSWSHPNAWISRRPPPPSFNSGSNR